MTKMFPFITKSWNPILMHCPHECYNGKCWATLLKQGRLKKLYSGLLEPTVLLDRLGKKFKALDFVFIESMGDLCAETVPLDIIRLVLGKTLTSPAQFLIHTKNPRKLFLALNAISPKRELPNNYLIGITMETNRPTFKWSKAPDPLTRVSWLNTISHSRKMVTMEPIMDFDLDVMLAILKNIKGLEKVAVGYDNYSSGMPEPSLEKTKQLIVELRKFVPEVIEKTLREPA